MTLQEIFDDLTYGELNQIAAGGADTFGVSVESRKRLVTHVNRGLSVLHRRFRIKMAEMQVPLDPLKREYVLENSDAPILKIESVRWPDELEKDPSVVSKYTAYLPLNTMDATYNVLMPRYNTLIVPSTVLESGATHLDVVYRANHSRIGKEDDTPFEPETVIIDLPEVFREPLLYYMASLAVNPLGPGIDGFHEGNNYHQKFEMACRAIENQGMQISESVEQTKFQRNGWI